MISFRENEPLAGHTRFAIGGPARRYAECGSEAELAEALQCGPAIVIGGGTNLLVADEGVDGAVLRYTADKVQVSGTQAHAQAGATLQSLVDATIAAGLAGIHTMTRIPGSVGGAVYGNAGAYGHSICEWITSVRVLDNGRVRTFGNADCDFRYRESAFKANKHWIVLDCELQLKPGDEAALRREAHRIQTIRDEKYPPDMKCAGSIFKNLILAELAPDVAARVPPAVIREGKVPSAWFLEQVGAKGMLEGDIQVADYHANLIYNAGHGAAAQVRRIIFELQRRVLGEFGLHLEEEVQYVGFKTEPVASRAGIQG
jgi:UDP-N-acetylmuramate dehydrogenase